MPSFHPLFHRDHFWWSGQRRTTEGHLSGLVSDFSYFLRTWLSENVHLMQVVCFRTDNYYFLSWFLSFLKDTLHTTLSYDNFLQEIAVEGKSHVDWNFGRKTYSKMSLRSRLSMMFYLAHLIWAAGAWPSRSLARRKEPLRISWVAAWKLWEKAATSGDIIRLWLRGWVPSPAAEGQNTQRTPSPSSERERSQE